MKWDILQGDIIKKLYAVNEGIHYCIESDNAGAVQIFDKYCVYRMPMFYCYIAFPPMCKCKSDIIQKAWMNAIISPLIARRVELIRKAPVQIFENIGTGEEIKVNTRFYSKYVEKADQISFWGTDYRSPVFGINGDSPDWENIVFMVLPIV